VQHFVLVVREDHRVGANRFAGEFGLLDFDLAARAEEPAGELFGISFGQAFAEVVALAASRLGG
jgi:hypothetical protein